MHGSLAHKLHPNRIPDCEASGPEIATRKYRISVCKAMWCVDTQDRELTAAFTVATSRGSSQTSYHASKCHTHLLSVDYSRILMPFRISRATEVHFAKCSIQAIAVKLCQTG
jgi:hypothetical protein